MTKNERWEIPPSFPEYPKISLEEERLLIAKAKRGCRKDADELVLRHIKFVILRIRKKAFRPYLERFGDDLFSEAVFVLYDKINTYNLRYKDKEGNFKPVRFSSYIWKRIDGLILDTLKTELERERRHSVVDWERCNPSSVH